LGASAISEDVIPQQGGQSEDLDDEAGCRERERAGEPANAPVIRLPEPIEVVGEAPIDLRKIVADGIEPLIEPGPRSEKIRFFLGGG
jgi:hypothetical protein